ncbi:hypothetical protein ATV_gp25 [Bicaudavirus pozzuoliense]|uniref:Uncharacterized protein ORF111 n=2 Tax=Acidianus two-tailed virus TaxID=315953 RepID=Y111_ATV|nr:hypothetical protein ATV_gp25 [Acidianus two-tailed virus]Q3V4W1.1 RecName: Full=Uncharacterized protein ORF111; Flags: Precursor [Acidianus two-tailed virus]CAI59853.1 hypothetical protein [Acidianus two-tailed virus]
MGKSMEEGIFVKVFPSKAIFVIYKEVEIIVKPDYAGDTIKVKYVFNSDELQKKLVEYFNKFNVPYKEISKNEVEVYYDPMYQLDCFDHMFEKLTMGDTDYIDSILGRLLPI